MEIRNAVPEDLDAVAIVEAECFPPAEAATKGRIAERIAVYGNHFWLLFEDDKLIAFVNGMTTDSPDLTDEMYANAAMHCETGAWQMIFGLNTLPRYRNKGYAAMLVERVISDAKGQKRQGVVLTCKSHLVPYYAKFGFQNEGVTEKSTHGGAVWNQMRLTFDNAAQEHWRDI